MSKKAGCITESHGFWVLRFREKVSEGGTTRTVNRSQRICAISKDVPNEKSARKLCGAQLAFIAAGQTVEPGFNLRLGEFVRDKYLQHVDAHRKFSTGREYRRLWTVYLEPLAGQMW